MERVKVIKMKKIKEEAPRDTAKEFLTALDAIVKEKGIDKNQVLEAMELALASAYKKHTGKTNGKAKVDPVTGDIKVYSYVTVGDEDMLGQFMICQVLLAFDQQKNVSQLIYLASVKDEQSPEDIYEAAADKMQKLVEQLNQPIKRSEEHTSNSSHL